MRLVDDDHLVLTGPRTTLELERTGSVDVGSVEGIEWKLFLRWEYEGDHRRDIEIEETDPPILLKLEDGMFTLTSGDCQTITFGVWTEWISEGAFAAEGIDVSACLEGSDARFAVEALAAAD